MYVLITHACGHLDEVRAFSDVNKAYAAAFEAIKALLTPEILDWMDTIWSCDLKAAEYVREFRADNVQHCVDNWNDVAELVSDGMEDEIRLVEAEVE